MWASMELLQPLRQIRAETLRGASGEAEAVGLGCGAEEFLERRPVGLVVAGFCCAT
jgi:hypothetical protein